MVDSHAGTSDIPRLSVFAESVPALPMPVFAAQLCLWPIVGCRSSGSCSSIPNSSKSSKKGKVWGLFLNSVGCSHLPVRFV